MIVTIVHVFVKPEYVDAFIQATRENHEHSIQEPENLRFDILQDENDPCKFVLYEAYRSEKGVLQHKETAHYLKWRDAVAPWMAKPREGVKHKMIYPLL